ncbi:hypothetical protein D3C72_1826000 [compost metagenome]
MRIKAARRAGGHRVFRQFPQGLRADAPAPRGPFGRDQQQAAQFPHVSGQGMAFQHRQGIRVYACHMGLALPVVLQDDVRREHGNIVGPLP